MMNLTFQQLIDKRVQSDGDAIFCYIDDRTITFRELAELITSHAAALHAAGLKRGERVALMLPNCIEHIALFFAACKLGSIVVPVSIHLRSSGLALQLNGAQPHRIVAHAAYDELVRALPELKSVECIVWLGERLPAATPRNTTHVRLSELLPAAPTSAHPPIRHDDLDEVCAISYTSGTTGAPKGAMLTQRWFQVGAKNAGILADVRPSDVLFLWEPFYHVAGWMTVLMSLQHGIPMAMVEKFSATQCWRQIERHGATLFHYLGGALNLLLKQPPTPLDRSNPVRIAWGAAAPAHNWHEFEKRFGLKLREGYGITEAGNFTMLNLDGPIGSIGKPVEEFEAWIERDDGTRAATGEIGEIVLRPKDPAITMRGYFNDAARTGDVLRNGCVHTGDLGHQDSDGNFFFAGRKKEALRHRGENVSAWEVERIINAHASVEESAVIGVPSPMGEQDIMAYVKPTAGYEISPLEIIRWCEKHLAYYQVPRYIRVVDDFPRGPTQRIRKTELPAETHLAWDFEKSGEQSAAHRIGSATLSQDGK